jgi:hypothetical protein
MIGQILQERRPFPTFAVICLIMAALCLAGGFADRDSTWTVIAILPAMVGGMVLLGRPRPFHAELTDHEFVVHSGGMSMQFREITRLSFVGSGRHPDSGFVDVFCGTSVVRVPERTLPSPVEFYRFFASRLAIPVSASLHDSVAGYFQAQTQTFGIERVWAHVARQVVQGKRSRTGAFASLGMLLAAAAWCVAGAVLNRPEWFFAAFFLVLASLFVWLLTGGRKSGPFTPGSDIPVLILALLLGPFWFLVFAVNRASVDRRAKRFSNSGLAISPAGLALAQADIIGHLRWAELKKIRLATGSLFSRPTLNLYVEGAVIQILDIYDSPISTIHEQIDQYWKAG